jgi:YidC/Oxa1 family membrane protein insertase
VNLSNEQRVFLAIVLMGIVWVVYTTYFVPHEAPPARNASSSTTQAPAPTPSPAPGPSPVTAPLVPGPAAAAENRPPQRLARVSTPLSETVISSEGGKIQELTLKYRGDKPLVILGELGPTGLVVASSGNTSAQVVPMELPTEALVLTRERPTQDVVLTGSVEGLRVRETMKFRADDYTIDVRLRLENATRTPQTVTVALPWSTRQDWTSEGKAKEKFAERFGGQHPTEIVWSSQGRLSRDENLCAITPITTEGEWIAVGSSFYMTALIPHEGDFKLVASGDPKACESKGKEPVGRATIAVQAMPTIAPGQAWEGRVTIFAGPKEYDQLKAAGLEATINFGGFPMPRKYGGLPMEWLGVPILLILNWVHRHVGNYGVAIILLTVVSKVLFYPLTVKSMRSMKAMQALQPQINALRSKYKSDPQRLQKETMDLYRQHGVNPLGGCLPMIAQVPIFYALYLALSVSVDLQNATFLCFGSIKGVNFWICDLAGPDHTYILPLLMGVTMFMQQKMTPMGGDPRQAKAMLIMPFFFTFMFFSLASGLVLYWTVSNILQILQQWLMDRPKRRAARA